MLLLEFIGGIILVASYKYPVLKGKVHLSSKKIRVWCPECNKSHYHRWEHSGNKTKKVYVQEAACKRLCSKYRLTGYYIMEL